MKRMILTMVLAITASVFSVQAQGVITDPAAQKAQQEAIKAQQEAVKAQKAAEKEAKKQQKAIEKRKKKRGRGRRKLRSTMMQ